MHPSENCLGVAKVAIIILNWNGWRDSIACVESTLDLVDGDCVGVILCDNASIDDSVARIRDWGATQLFRCNSRRIASGKRPYRFVDRSSVPVASLHSEAADEDGIGVITLLQSGWNGGYAAGNNVGILYALTRGFDYFWILNNDTLVRPDSLLWLIDRVAEDPGIGICGSTVVYADKQNMIQTTAGCAFIALKGRGSPLGMNSSANAPIDRTAVESRLSYVNGASMLVSRAFIELIGLMQEDYFLYWEEMDWATRGRGKFRLGYAPKSVVFHKVGASIGTNDSGEPSALSEYYMTRSRMRYCLRFSKRSVPFILFDVTREMLRWAKKGKWARVVNLLRASIQLPMLL